MRIITLDEIKKVLPSIDLISEIEAGFVSYSEGRAVVPPVGELILEKGEVHIKYGYITGDESYVIKIASGFYGNSKLGLPTGNGLMLLFKQETGEPEAIMLDEGHLTDIRTAVAGAIAAKYMAPKVVHKIGIIGTGVQARLQLEQLQKVTDCREVLVWGRGEKQIGEYIEKMKPKGFRINGTLNANSILTSCNLVVTTTPAKEPILFHSDLKPGTHITAVGSDVAEKQELDSRILKTADIVVADSISQCLVRGEIFHAISNACVSESDLIELGDVISAEEIGRTSDDEITVADLTGVAVQDIKIAKAVFKALKDS